jgi:hypothetical protein
VNAVREGRAAVTDVVRSARPALLVSLVVVLVAVAACVGLSAASGGDDAGRAAPTAGPTPPAGIAAAEPDANAPTGPPPPKEPTVRPVPSGAAGSGRLVGGGLLFGAQLQALPPLADIRQDEGASVSLPDGRTLYVFADTLHLHTTPKFFATSSGALTDPRTPLRLEYAANPRGVPLEFMPREPDEKTSQVNGVRYTAVWPTGATNLPDGRTIIAYSKYDIVIQPRPSMTFRGAGLYEFRYQDAARFRNGGQAHRIADDIWQPDTGAVGTPTYHDGFVYFTLCEDLECYSLRAAPGGLADVAQYRWWTGDGWSPSKADRSPMRFGASRPGHNPSVVWVPAVDAFVMADTVAGSVARSGLIWVSPNPWGPWSVPATVGLTRCSSKGCYGLNVQAAQSTANTIRISYSPVMVKTVGPFVYLIDQAVRVSNGGRRVTTG